MLSKWLDTRRLGIGLTLAGCLTGDVTTLYVAGWVVASIPVCIELIFAGLVIFMMSFNDQDG